MLQVVVCHKYYTIFCLQLPNHLLEIIYMLERARKFLSKPTLNAIFIIAVAIAPAAQSADIEEITKELKAGNFEVVKTELVPMAESGNPRAQFNLGVSYAMGNGVEKDFGKAYEWTKKAAENGEVRAQVNLASIYLEGRGAQKDVAQSVKWYDKAAQSGDLNANLSLGRMYRDGVPGKVDYVKSYKYFSAAAEKGDNEARYNLAGFYRFGLGVKQNEAKSKEMFASLPGPAQNMTSNFASLETASGTNKTTK